MFSEGETPSWAATVPAWGSDLGHGDRLLGLQQGHGDIHGDGRRADSALDADETEDFSLFGRRRFFPHWNENRLRTQGRAHARADHHARERFADVVDGAVVQAHGDLHV